MFLLKGRQDAIKWIEEHLCGKTRLSVQEILDGAKKFLETGDRIQPDWDEIDDYFGDFNYPEEFWEKYEIITGEKLPADEVWKRDYFIECCA